MKTILVPVDLSKATVRVCDAACALARAIKGRLVLLHVVEPAPVVASDYGVGAAQLGEWTAAGERYAAVRLRELARRCVRKEVPVATVRRTGRAVAGILARAADVDYIVIGSHGHTAVYDLLVGSTTHGILRGARCPVLVVPMAPRRR